MNAKLLAVLVALFALGNTALAVQDRPARPEQDEEKVAQIQKRLGEPVPNTEGLQGKMSLSNFLTALEGKLPDGKKCLFQIDREAFGKDFPQVDGATVDLPVMKNALLAIVLRRALAQVPVPEIDFGIRPGGVVITSPQRAAYPRTYDVRLLLPRVPSLLHYFGQQVPAEVYQDIKPADGAALLPRLLMNAVDLRQWESVEVLNGARLVVVAGFSQQEEIATLLEALRRLDDVTVVMNARLYEVDRAFVRKHVTPLFPKDPEERSAVVAIEKPLLQMILKEKLLLESEELKIGPNQEAPFLSRHSVFRFNAGPWPDKVKESITGTGMAGVSFSVKPLVSPDRRYLRLQISQKTVQLVGIDKTKVFDPVTGKEAEVESPNLRKTTVTGTVQIPDIHPILMPVSYQPPGKGNEDKVWLLVARPVIRIEEEVKEGIDITPQTIWACDVPKEEPPAPAPPVAFNDDVKEVLQAVVTDLLTNKDLKDTREFYGTAKDRTLSLVDGKLGWPKEFAPLTHGYKLVEVHHDPFVNPRRILGIRIHKFELKQKKDKDSDGPIEVCLFNAGGSANGGVIGGCLVYYVPKRVGTRWTVECVGILDP
jgi:hypothetical protein